MANSLKKDITPLKEKDVNSGFFTASKKSKESKEITDRFIPNKVCANLFNIYFANDNNQKHSNPKLENNFQSNSEHMGIYPNYNVLLENELFGDRDDPNMNIGINSNCGENGGKHSLTDSKNIKKKKIIQFKSTQKSEALENNLDSLLMPNNSNISSRMHSALNNNLSASHNNKASRRIAKEAYKVLDAPGLQDDFYLNLLDWSSNNQIAIG